jgi:hypothetical protein
MSEVWEHLGNRLAALAVASVLTGGLAMGTAFAAEYEVRRPVEKTIRFTPLGDVQDQDQNATKAAPAKSTSSDEVGRKTPKAASGKTATPAAAHTAPAPEHKTVVISEPATAHEKHAKAAAKKEEKAGKGLANAKAAPDAASESAAVSPPVPAAPRTKSPKSAPVPQLDQKAMVMPAAPTVDEPSQALPADGKWVGSLGVSFREQEIVLHAGTNAAPEHVTWFNLAEPRKLAVDLRGEWHKKGDRVFRFDTGPVKNIIVGEHPDRLRLAVEFRDGAAQPDVEPKIVTGPDGVTVTIPLVVHLAR